MADAETTSISLRKDEALVLFELLARWIEDERGRKIKSHIRDDAELWALNRTYSALQRELAEPFQPDFSSIVKRACDELRERSGGAWPF